MNNWTLLYTTPDQAEASIFKGYARRNHIKVIVMNRQDSSYLNFGEIELYVPAHLKEVAKDLMGKGWMN